MKLTNDIQLISSENIDTQKWNSCIHYAVNGNIGGYSWYLNNISEEWVGLVYKDYEEVFPLIIHEKGWIFKKNVISASPFGLHQGPFTTGFLSSQRLSKFIENLSSVQQPIESIYIGAGYDSKVLNGSFSRIEKKEQRSLMIMRSYEEIQGGYSSELKTILSNTETPLTPVSSLKPEKFAQFIVDNNSYFGLDVKKSYFTILRIIYNILHRGWGFFSGYEDNEGNLVCASFFVSLTTKSVVLFSAQSKKGKVLHASALLLDSFVQTNAGRPMMLDLNIDFNPHFKEHMNMWGAEASQGYLVRK